MATRNTKTQTAQAIPEVELPEVEFSSVEFIKSMASMAGIELPTGRQVLVGFAVAVVVGFAGAYATSSLASYIAMGALVLSGSAFLSLLMMVITYVIGIYVTFKATAKFSTWIASGSVKDDMSNAKNWITSKFTRAPAPVAA